MERVSIPEAARRLGVTQDTIRRRIRKGEVAAYQEPRPQGYVWFVDVPEEELSSEEPPYPNFKEETSEVQLLREMMELLRDELKTKDRQLEAREREVQELHILLQQFQTALPAAGDNRSWWYKLWHRNVR
jgi:predicted transcriptional regulator